MSFAVSVICNAASQVLSSHSLEPSIEKLVRSKRPMSERFGLELLLFRGVKVGVHKCKVGRTAPRVSWHALAAFAFIASVAAFAAAAAAFLSIVGLSFGDLEGSLSLP